MRQVVKGGRKALLEKEAVAGTAALRNKVLQRKQEGMEGLAAQVEALAWELREATDDAARARARVGDLQEEVVARMESGKALAEENCALEERVKELEELFRSGVEENLALEAVVAAKTAELEDAVRPPPRSRPSARPCIPPCPYNNSPAVFEAAGLHGAII
mmetsp:Transcript_14202/g.36446  ORF Transcript_14202/g.36446 Transcript_14202/m.36446 type:complete len:161 (-) Transcript_14202:28-510(-)